MNGIKMSDCKFYVNEEERTVICVIPKTDWMVLDFIGQHCAWSGDFDFSHYNLNYNIEQQLLMPKSFVGKAKCMPEDEWNEETGKLIAFSRAKDKCYKSFFKRANLFVQRLDARLGDMIGIFNDFGMKLDSKREALQNQINERVGVGTSDNGDA